MDWDLNQEPAQSQEEDSLGRLLVELEDYHGRIEERMHQLESVVTRARERSSQNSSSSNSLNRVPSSSASSNFGDGIKRCKIGGAHLLAEALATDSPCQNNVNSTSTSSSLSAVQCKSGGSVFDCNVCFALARNPVLTCCGHLFCWPCFYSLPNSDSDSSKECPVCQGEVLEADVTPIYGAASESNANDQPCFKIPPRPRGRRIPTLSVSPNHQRFSRIFRAAPSLPTQERIRQLSFQVGPAWHSQPLSNNTFPSPSQVADNPSIQPHRFSRLSSQAQAQPSSIMSHVQLPPSSHEDSIIRQYDLIVNAGPEMNSSHGLATATDGSNSRQTTRNRSLYSRRRSSSGIGLAVRTQRRRDGFGS